MMICNSLRPNAERRQRAGSLQRALTSAAALLIVVFLAGCEEELSMEYGQRGGRSVNGTGVLADMFDQQGHTVTTWRALSPRLESADTIVWFPNSFDPPSPHVQQWFEDWLSERPGRTLIYVGRDYDAAPLYWEKAGPLAPANLQPEFERRRQNAATVFAQLRTSARSRVSTTVDSDWFDIATLSNPHNVRSLSGPWSTSIDPAKVEITLHSRFVPGDDAEILLESANNAIVTRQTFEQDFFSYGRSRPPYAPAASGQDSQLIVVTNGSFLLNFPLVNQEHRKLAGKLIAQAGPPGRTVFLESDDGDPPILDDDPANNPPTGLEIFGIWPMSIILLHIAAAGIVFCFARAPIFGRPRDPRSVSRSDFARHLRAMGELLSRTQDYAYAQARLKHYHQNVRGDADGLRTTRRADREEQLQADSSDQS